MPTSIKNTLKEANYKYIFDVLIDIYNGDIYNKPKVGPIVVERILTSISSAGWKIITNSYSQKFYAEYIDKYKEDSLVYLYIESRYHDYDELVKMYSGHYDVNPENFRHVIKIVEDKIITYISKQSRKNKSEWWDDKFNIEEIRNLKLAGIYTIEKAKDFF